MTAFNNLIEQVALKEKLVKVQLKTDPAYSNLGTISKFQGYIGYILRENRTLSKVYLEQVGTVVVVPNGMIEPVQNKLSKVDLFKLAALRYLKEKRDIKQTDILTKLIINCNSIEYVESFCLDNGCSQDDIKNIYKIAFNSTITEGLWGLAKGAAKLAFGRAPNEPLIQGEHPSSWKNLKQPFKNLLPARKDKDKDKDKDKSDDGTSSGAPPPPPPPAAAAAGLSQNISNFREEIRRIPTRGNLPASQQTISMVGREVIKLNNRTKSQEYLGLLANAQTASSNKITNSQLLACYFNAVS